MPLHDFASNIPDINIKLKDLGMQWDYEKDLWFISAVDFEIVLITKRSILSDIARLYDPCGFLAPLTILAHFTIPRKELGALSLEARFLKFILTIVSKYFKPNSLHLLPNKQQKELFIRSRVVETKCVL